jgi:hypothetical protein
MSCSESFFGVGLSFDVDDLGFAYVRTGWCSSNVDEILGDANCCTVTCSNERVGNVDCLYVDERGSDGVGWDGGGLGGADAWWFACGAVAWAPI